VTSSGDLHVCVIDQRGGLFHAVRASNASWTSFEDVQAQTDRVGPNAGIGPTPMVACAAAPSGDLHICAIDVNGGLWHTIRQATGPTWPFRFGDVQAQTRQVGPNPGIGPTPYVACAVDPSGDLHVCATDLSGGLWHTIRKADKTWPFAFGNVLAVTRGSIPRVCASLAQQHQLLENEYMHVVDPIAKAKLGAEIAQVYEEQRQNGCFPPDTISTVACAAQGVGELHVCAIDMSGNLFRAQRLANGGWTAFESVATRVPSDTIGMTPSVACSTTAELDLHITVIA
jgi:hypothetical protein